MVPMYGQIAHGSNEPGKQNFSYGCTIIKTVQRAIWIRLWASMSKEMQHAQVALLGQQIGV